MTSPHDSRNAAADDVDPVGQLMKLAGRRPAPDPSQVARARAAAHDEWVRIAGRRRRWPLWSWAGAAVAAGVLIAAGWPLLRHTPAPVPGAEVGTLQAVTGSVLIASAGEGPRTISAAGSRMRVGDRIDTTDEGRAALAMPGGVSVRFDRATAAVVSTADSLYLTRGAVYVDTGGQAADSALHIETPLATIRHTGTQFEVRLGESALTVRVREGSVAVETSAGQWTSRAGEALVVGSRGAPQRSPIPSSGPEWSWVSGLAAPFQLEGATAPAFLEWVSREQGWRWEYADPSLRPRVERIVLHGSIEGLTPEEALAAVLPTCGLTARREGQRLIVGAVTAR